MSTSEGQTRTTLELRAFIDAFPAIAWSALPDGSLDFINQRFRDYTGLSSDQLYGSEWKSAVHRDDIQKIETWWQHVSQSQEPGTTEKRLRRFDGEYRWFQIAAAPVHDEQANLVRWCGINTDIHDLKCSEQKLRQQEAEFRTITDAVRQSIVVMAPDGTILYANRVVREVTGLTTCEVNDKTFLTRVYHPDDLDRVLAGRQEGLLRGTPFELEARVLIKGGPYRWWLLQYNPLRDESGQISRWYGTGTDIDDRKRAEQELKRSQEFLAEGQRLSRTGSFSWRISTDEISWSDETFRIFEYDPLMKPTVELVLDRVHPDDRAKVEEQIERATRDGKDFDREYRLLMPDGSVKHVHVVAHAVEDETGIVEFVGAVMDVTTAKQVEEKIREREAELRQVLDLTPQIVNVYGPGGERIYCNRFGVEYAGISLEEWRQARIPGRQWLHPDERERIAAIMDSLSTGAVPPVYEHRLRKSDGSYRWFLARWNALRDEEGQITRWYVASTDIDERKQAEERLQRENVALREEIDKASMFEEIVGASPALRAVLSAMAKVAPTESTVLITGETGTGKELIARAIHKQSSRSTRAFIAVNCAAIPPSLIASELFGHEKGAFTGATERRIGRFEAANGGTIFLDEVGDLPVEVQISLLRVLQEREVEHVGSNKPIPVDVRVLAATHRALEKLVSEGKFRQDLFYRLNVFPIAVPPLRERAADIPLLVEYFVGRFAKGAGKNIRHIGKDTLGQLKSYRWPGNIRELQNVVERAVILSETDTLAVDEGWLKRESGGSSPHEGLSALADRETEMIEAALAESHGRISGSSDAAVKLGIPRQTLESKIRRLGIDKYGLKRPPSK